jgi:hypothetical protein
MGTHTRESRKYAAGAGWAPADERFEPVPGAYCAVSHQANALSTARFHEIETDRSQGQVMKSFDRLLTADDPL